VTYATREEAKAAGWHSRRHVNGQAQAEHKVKFDAKIKARLERAHKKHPPGQKPNPELNNDQIEVKKQREASRSWHREG